MWVHTSSIKIEPPITSSSLQRAILKTGSLPIFFTVKGSHVLQPNVANIGYVSNGKRNAVRVIVISPNGQPLRNVTCKSSDRKVQARVCPATDEELDMMNGVYDRAAKARPGMAVVEVAIKSLEGSSSLYCTVTIAVDGETMTLPVYAQSNNGANQ